jgi:hypothetical protein
VRLIVEEVCQDTASTSCVCLPFRVKTKQLLPRLNTRGVLDRGEGRGSSKAQEHSKKGSERRHGEVDQQDKKVKIARLLFDRSV